MTEDEAKTKWCPFVRVTSLDKGDGSSWNRFQGGGATPVNSLCIGSACMAWRWADKQPPGHGFFGDGTPHARGALGFCGLAGQQ